MYDNDVTDADISVGNFASSDKCSTIVVRIMKFIHLGINALATLLHFFEEKCDTKHT